MNLSQFEEPTPPYNGNGEMVLAISVLPFAFLHVLLESLYGSRAIPGQPWLYILLLGSFSALALSTVLLLATPGGDRWIRRMLTDQRLLLLSFLPVGYAGSYLLVLRLLGLPQLTTHALAKIGQPWSQLPLPVFLVLAGCLLTAGFYGGLRLALAKQTRCFSVRQLGCVILAALPYLLLQTHLPLLWCFTTPVAVIVMVYATGLGREHFGFSFVPRSLREIGAALVFLAAGLAAFLLITIFSGSITYTGKLWNSPWTTQYNAAFMWLVIVGISEEVLFRCGLLTLLAAWLTHRIRHPRLNAVLLTSVFFGVAHLYRGVAFASLAFIASLLYGLSFVAGKNLFGPVLLHGVMNVLILRNFQL